ncbi:uncharacterized protein LOC114519373 [Dendronephthya gigantea]|uniref:uncharacterized protein LOC114519373 n=1 Tax=Dendronephthya gigantea TaxID=151771 RepID=UPI00106979F8|nr:uncharacterized protein LOC114519373 [Dendronephthya gigantea]
MEVKIRVESECPLPGDTPTLFEITLENVKCIGELKKKLQPLLSVAICDMSIYLCKTPIYDRKLEDNEQISNLYVQEGDTFIVKFISVCDMQSIGECLNDMKAFIKKVVDEFSKVFLKEEVIDVNWNDDDEFISVCYHLYETVLTSLEKCMCDIFMTWRSKKTNANKRFFVQEGGLELLAKCYDFSSRKFSIKNWEKYNLGSFIHDMNHNSNRLEISCLHCLWNFMEKEKDRSIVLKMIGLEPFINSFLKVSSDVDQEYFVISINEAAVGCLCAFIELPDMPPTVTKNQEILSKFLWLTSNASDDYEKIVAANALFSCSVHPKAAVNMIENNCHHSMLEEAQLAMAVFQSEDDPSYSPMVVYYFCLSLANILTLPEENVLKSDEIENIDQVLEEFVQKFKPSDIGDFEKENTFTWVTLIPFVKLAMSGPKCGQVLNGTAEKSQESCEAKNNTDTRKTRTQYMFSPAEKLGLFSLCHLVKVDVNREIFRKEKIVDYLICLRWFALKSSATDVNDLSPKLDHFGELEPPRLESIAKAYLSKCFGYKVL